MLYYERIIRNTLVFLGLVILAGCQTPPPMESVYPESSIVEEPVEYVESKPTSAIISSIYFAFGSWAINPESRMTLDNLATAMLDSRLSGQNFVIQGHTDIVGSLKYNLALSELRAMAVIDYLVHRGGVDPTYLSYEGFGYLRLKDPSNPRSSVNRRVEILTFSAE